MNLTLPPDIRKLIDDRMKSGKYRTAEDVVAAAMSTLDQQDDLGDFSPGELEELLAKGKQDIACGDVLDGDKVFAELRQLSANRRKKAE